MSKPDTIPSCLKLSELTAEIEAYAAAKASGNPLLIQRQGIILQGLLQSLPPELPTKEQPPDSNE